MTIRTGRRGVRNKVLLAVLVAAILGALGMVGYNLANAPDAGEEYTEFYILGSNGQAGGYPGVLSVGQEGKVIAGIINREHRAVTYRLEVIVGGVKQSEVGPVDLERDEKWEEQTGFIPESAGDSQEVEFLLHYTLGQVEVCKKLNLWVDVIEREHRALTPP